MFSISEEVGRLKEQLKIAMEKDPIKSDTVLSEKTQKVK